MSRIELLDEAQRLLFDEAAALDQRRWDDWLALYTEDCEFWVPAWKSEDTPTADPGAEVSLVYYDSRVGLEERVWRIQSAAAPAHRLLPRTCHAVHNVRLLDVACTASHLARGQLQGKARHQPVRLLRLPARRPARRLAHRAQEDHAGQRLRAVVFRRVPGVSGGGAQRGRVSRMRRAASPPDRAVRAATDHSAARSPNRSAMRPASSAPTA